MLLKEQQDPRLDEESQSEGSKILETETDLRLNIFVKVRFFGFGQSLVNGVIVGECRQLTSR